MCYKNITKHRQSCYFHITEEQTIKLSEDDVTKLEELVDLTACPDLVQGETEKPKDQQKSVIT